MDAFEPKERSRRQDRARAAPPDRAQAGTSRAQSPLLALRTFGNRATQPLLRPGWDLPERSVNRTVVDHGPQQGAWVGDPFGIRLLGNQALLRLQRKCKCEEEEACSICETETRKIQIKLAV